MVLSQFLISQGYSQLIVTIFTNFTYKAIGKGRIFQKIFPSRHATFKAISQNTQIASLNEHLLLNRTLGRKFIVSFFLL
jgi:hypothetical protein